MVLFYFKEKLNLIKHIFNDNLVQVSPPTNQRMIMINEPQYMNKII